MTASFESILDESISALQAGVSIDEILAEVPEYAEELRPLLFASSLLADPNPEFVAAEKKAELRAEYMRQVAELPTISAPTMAQKTQAVLHVTKRRITPESLLKDLLTVAATILLTVLMMILILNYLATAAIPGDVLYDLKRTSETIRLRFASSDAGQTELLEAFNQRRLEEIQKLIEQNRAAVVQFNGPLQTKGEQLWVVAGYTIVLPEDIIVDDAIQEGDILEVVGLLRTNGGLVADTIRVIDSP